MIVVTVGSNGAAFDRLLQEIDTIDADEELFVQHGPSTIRPRNARCVPFLHFAELEDAVRSARIVITHAGVGSVLLALRNGKKPIVVPRRAQYSEVVDDHQVHFAERLARDDVVTMVDDPKDLAEIVASSHGGASSFAADSNSLQTELRSYLRSQISPGTTR